MIKIHFLAPLERYARAISIKIIQRKMQRIRGERRLEFFRQPGIARAAAAHNSHQQEAPAVLKQAKKAYACACPLAVTAVSRCADWLMTRENMSSSPEMYWSKLNLSRKS